MARTAAPQGSSNLLLIFSDLDLREVQALPQVLALGAGQHRLVAGLLDLESGDVPAAQALDEEPLAGLVAAPRVRAT